MTRGLFAAVVGTLLLSGCGDSPRVERKPLTEPVTEAPKAAMPGGPSAAGGMMHETAAPADVPSNEVNLGKYVLTASKAWTRKQPKIDIILAEFSLPRAEGDPADGRLTVTVAGGSVAENIDRWRKQFGDKPEKESQDKIDVSGVPITLVDFSGTYQGGAMPGMMAAAAELPHYRMLGAIFDLDGQLHFLKCYGPAKTIAARADEFRALVKSLKPTGN
jgi:hypothetical protein